MLAGRKSLLELRDSPLDNAFKWPSRCGSKRRGGDLAIRAEDDGAGGAGGGAHR
jgi:hypothetical protein